MTKNCAADGAIALYIADGAYKINAHCIGAHPSGALMPDPNEYAFYDAMIRGDRPPLINGQTESGWWRWIKPDRSMVAVATWKDVNGSKWIRFDAGAYLPITSDEMEATLFD